MEAKVVMISIKEVIVGDIIAKDLYKIHRGTYVLLIREGVVLERKDIDALRRNGVVNVPVCR